MNSARSPDASRVADAPRVKVSLLVPAHNEAGNIQNMLRSVLAQKTDRAEVLEVVVVASGCTDGTADLAREIARDRPGIHVHVQERRDGKVAAINEYLLRLRSPRADVVICASADLCLHADVVERIAAVFEANPRIGMVGARPVPDNDTSTLIGKTVSLLWDMHHQVALVSPKMGELIAFRAALVDRVNELSVVDEASVEDIVRSKGFDLAYVPDAVVVNHGPESWREYFDQRRRIARGHHWLAFAFGYRVATLDRGLLTSTVRDTFAREDARGKLALGAAIGVEVAARAAGFYDARVVGGRHRTWTHLSTTKTLRTHAGQDDAK